MAIYVNEKKREAENISRVLEIQNNFTGKFEVSSTSIFLFTDLF